MQALLGPPQRPAWFDSATKTVLDQIRFRRRGDGNLHATLGVIGHCSDQGDIGVDEVQPYLDLGEGSLGATSCQIAGRVLVSWR
jgi:hypothetical protein